MNIAAQKLMSAFDEKQFVLICIDEKKGKKETRGFHVLHAYLQ